MEHQREAAKHEHDDRDTTGMIGQCRVSA